MSQAVLDLFGERQVTLWDDGELSRDLRRVRLVEKAYGTRLAFGRDETGHGDVGTAFAIAAYAARAYRLNPGGSSVNRELICSP